MAVRHLFIYMYVLREVERKMVPSADDVEGTHRAMKFMGCSVTL